MKVWLKYFRHLRRLLMMSLQSVLMYRIDFGLRIIRSIVEVGTSWITIQIFFSQAPAIAGWTKIEALLVYVLALLVVSVVMLIGGSGIEGLHREIANGSLDKFLLQPMDTQWLASTRVIYVTNIFRVIFNLFLLVWVIMQMEINMTGWDWILLIINILSACLIYYSIIFCAAVVSFWSLNGDLFYLFNSLTSVIRYPADIFPRTIKIVITYIPLIFITTVPTYILIGRPGFLVYLTPLIGGLLFWLTRIFWNYGLRSYQSVSS